ncbi:hypothetical protein HK104_008401 [Borealophlyctis nickersoniae]|nr:hypothetical protein HK104_008401 [Borealophlyctis nickersoniae]
MGKANAKTLDPTTSTELSPPYSPVLILIHIPIIALYVWSIVVYIQTRILRDPIHWANPLYAVDKAWIFYHVHWAAFLFWQLILGPYILVKHFNSPRVAGVYWTTWLAFAVGTAIPLLSVQRTKQTLGSGTFIAAGVIANALSAVFLIVFAVLVPAYRRFRPSAAYGNSGVSRATAWAFHVFAGYNLAAFPIRYLLFDHGKSQGAQAGWHWGLLVYHLVVVGYLIFAWRAGRRAPHAGPLRRYSVLNWVVNAVFVVLTFAPLVAWRKTCVACGKA